MNNLTFRHFKYQLLVNEQQHQLLTTLFSQGKDLKRELIDYCFDTNKELTLSNYREIAKQLVSKYSLLSTLPAKVTQELTDKLYTRGIKLIKKGKLNRLIDGKGVKFKFVDVKRVLNVSKDGYTYLKLPGIVSEGDNEWLIKGLVVDSISPLEVSQWQIDTATLMTLSNMVLSFEKERFRVTFMCRVMLNESRVHPNVDRFITMRLVGDSVEFNGDRHELFPKLKHYNKRIVHKEKVLSYRTFGTHKYENCLAQVKEEEFSKDRYMRDQLHQFTSKIANEYGVVYLVPAQCALFHTLHKLLKQKLDTLGGKIEIT